MADDDHKPSSAQCLRDILIIRGRRACHSDAKHGEQAKRDRERCNGSSSACLRGGILSNSSPTCPQFRAHR
jgi:hypothetical protein